MNALTADMSIAKLVPSPLLGSCGAPIYLHLALSTRNRTSARRWLGRGYGKWQPLSTITVIELAHGIYRAKSEADRQRRHAFVEELSKEISVLVATLELVHLAGWIEANKPPRHCNRVTSLLGRRHSLASGLLSGNPKPSSLQIDSRTLCGSALSNTTPQRYRALRNPYDFIATSLTCACHSSHVR
jgi:hypothetical protein